jgi:hypothetical protein
MNKELLRSITQPSHYCSTGSSDIIDFCHQYNISFSRGNVIKYLVRAGRKDDELADLNKALDYLNREIKYIKNCKL